MAYACKKTTFLAKMRLKDAILVGEIRSLFVVCRIIGHSCGLHRTTQVV